MSIQNYLVEFHNKDDDSTSIFNILLETLKTDYICLFILNKNTCNFDILQTSNRNKIIDLSKYDLIDNISSLTYDEVQKYGIISNFVFKNILICRILCDNELLGVLCVTNIPNDLNLNSIKSYLYFFKNIILKHRMQLEFYNLENIYKSGITNHVFLEHISHILRTPLNGIIGYGQLLLTMERSMSKEPFTFIKQINNCSMQIIRIINDLLDFSKLSSGKIFTNNLFVNFRDMMNTIKENVSHQILDKKLTLDISITDDIPLYINSDKKKIIQILMNLLSNSIKYTNELGKITISCHNRDNYIDFIIKDNGIGISKEDLYKIFNSFIQIENSKYKNGTGLGIYISTKLIELLNGHIKIDSTINEGTSVFFNIMYTKDYEYNIENISLLENRSIIVILNNNSIYQSIKIILEEWGMKTYICNSYYEATRIYFSKKDFFYFIVVDYPSSKKDLLECIKELRYDNSSLPIILFSNSPDFDETLFNYNLELPINKNLLFNILLSILYTHK
jgi:signal transduction histidine kinase